MKVEFHPETATDLNDAVMYYNRQAKELGNALRTEVYATIDRIIEHPELYAEANGVRRALVKRFPYSVIYRLTSRQSLRILVIRHHKQPPEHGAERH